MNKLTHDLKLPLGKDKYDVWIFAICIFCLAMPYFMWQVSLKPFLIVCAFLFIKNFEKSFNWNKILFVVPMVLLYLYTGIISNWSFFGIMFLLLITLIFFAKTKFLKQAFDVYVYIFSIMLIPSILQYILVTIIGLDMPHSSITSLNSGKMGVYSQYLFMVSYSGEEVLVDSIIPRFYSYFDEPGVLGTISAVILAVKKYNLKSWVNIPIFLSGVFSFSLFFYLMSAIYFFLFLENKSKLLTLIFLATMFLFFDDKGVFKANIIDRINLESNFIASLSTIRDGAGFDNWYSNFKKTPQYLTGMGASYSLIVNKGGSSYKNIVTDFGIIFLIMYLLAFIIYGIRSLGYSKELLVALLILFGVIYQRPFIQDMSYVFLIYVPFVFLKENRKEPLFILKNERKRGV